MARGFPATTASLMKCQSNVGIKIANNKCALSLRTRSLMILINGPAKFLTGNLPLQKKKKSNFLDTGSEILPRYVSPCISHQTPQKMQDQYYWIMRHHRFTTLSTEERRTHGQICPPSRLHLITTEVVWCRASICLENSNG